MKKFKNSLTEKIANGEIIGDISKDLIIRVKSKILLIISVDNLNDLRVVSSNNLEKLKDDRKGQYSIRVNDKYRICFDWINNEAFNIEFIDYHK
jgi:proteic killer suppression protein